MRTVFIIFILTFSINCFAGAGATFNIKNLSGHPVVFTTGNAQCMYNVNTTGQFVVKPNETKSLGYLEAKGSSSGGDTCATDRSIFHITAHDPAAVDEALPDIGIYVHHVVYISFWAWEDEEYNKADIISGSERFVFSNGGRDTRWDGSGNIEVDYYPCAKRADCFK